MKIIVFKASKPTYWYVNKIGEEFDVYETIHDDTEGILKWYRIMDDHTHSLDKNDVRIMGKEKIFNRNGWDIALSERDAR